MVTVDVIRANLHCYRPSSSAQADVKASLSTIIAQLLNLETTTAMMPFVMTSRWTIYTRKSY